MKKTSKSKPKAKARSRKPKALPNVQSVPVVIAARQLRQELRSADAPARTQLRREFASRVKTARRESARLKTVVA